MTSNALEHVEQTGTAIDVPAAEQRRLAALMKQCVTLAESKLVPKALQGEPKSIFALALYGEQFGLTPIHAVQRIYLVEGAFVEKAEVLGGVIIRAGHELRWDEVSSERCTVSIRRQGSAEWQSTTWTLDDARRAGLLDIWVENRVADGKWPDGNTKYRTDRFVVGDDTGVFGDDERARRALGPVPDWAAAKLGAGDVKRRDVWALYPGDMLAAKALRRAAKRIVGDALLGFDVEHDRVDDFLPDAVTATHTPNTAATGDDIDWDDGPDDDEPAAAAATTAPGADETIEDADIVHEPDDEEQPPQPDEEEPVLDPAAQHAHALKRLMVTCGKAFPEPDAPKGQKTKRQRLLRKAAQYAVFTKDGADDHRARCAANELTVDDLTALEAWVHTNFIADSTVTPLGYEILDDDQVKFTRGDRAKYIPPAEAA